MTYPYYTGNPESRRDRRPAQLPGSRHARQTDPAGYLADPGLVDAVNVALLLGQPLLVTGEPGVGKTQLAHSLAWELGYGEPLVFETKSSSAARDLLYGYDTVGRFHAAQTGEGSRRSLDYLTWHALGVAILQSKPREKVAEWLTEKFTHEGPRRSVVLVDEIDKAPRDFPNDLLNEVEKLGFFAPELANVYIEANPALRPVLVLTSNSEKNLPDAFLRRCVYYNIPFPGQERLAEIVMQRVGGFDSAGSPLLAEAMELFFLLREPAGGLRKRPATAELIGWLTALAEMGAVAGEPLRKQGEAARRTLSALVKSADDQETARKMVEDWLKSVA
jgi:MoxR-like ATPase